MTHPTPLRFHLRLGAAVLALAAWLAPAHGEEAPLGANLDGLIAYARDHNPELRAVRLEAEAARERIGAAAALPDPRFQLELMDATNAMSGRSASLLPGEVGETRYRVIQPLPFWGKRELRGEVARAQAAQSATLVDGTGVSLEARIKSAFVRYYEAAHQARILHDTGALVDALERLALTRYGVGLVPQQDVLRAQSELTALKVERVEAERRRREAAARLNALLPRPIDAPLEAPRALPQPREALVLATMLDQARAHSPELARERHGIIAADRERALTYRDRYPDFAVGLTNNRPRRGTNSWDVMLEVDIPLQQASRRAREREAETMFAAAEARLSAADARLSGLIGETLAVYEASRERSRLLRDTLLPQSEASFSAAQAGYEGGQVNFDTLIEAERRILSTRLSLLESEVEAAARLAELEQLVGAPL